MGFVPFVYKRAKALDRWRNLMITTNLLKLNDDEREYIYI